MQYLLLIYGDAACWAAMAEAERAGVLRAHAALVAELAASGELRGGAGLADPAQAGTVRMRDGVPATTAGSYAAGAQVSAYYLVDCATAARARALAARLLDPHVVAVEVRAVIDTAGPDAAARQRPP